MFKSVLHKIKTGPRAVSVLFVLISLMAYHSWKPLLAYLLTFLAFAVIFHVLGQLVSRLLPILYLGCVIVLIHSLVNPSNVHYIYIFGIEGFNYGLITALRLFNIAALTQLFLLLNPLHEIISAMSWIHPDLGIILALVLSTLPVMHQQMEITLKVQTARGLRRGRFPWQRLYAYLVILIPIIVKALVRGQVIAQLLHVRGYGLHLAKRNLELGHSDKIAIFLSLGFLIVNLLLANASLLGGL
ncbi:energy-coupling factor transporter transmembrane component T [Desulfosporosinus sp. FKB]|uniref:energy-coupling factor transporter transmembrane component T n=1 Tax=Desulfosporosinus sp. FKB TaxID=1969835 RepID=UPI000B4A03B2|nr:energy-coupling factor transporter transmembrane component T [Desulfosporosinus sp. FKB]